MRGFRKHLRYLLTSIAVLIVVIFSTPYITARYISIQYSRTSDFEEQFPVTVDPANKTIIENEVVNAYLEDQDLGIEANSLSSSQNIGKILVRLAQAISELMEGYNLALVSGEIFVTIPDGLRKEEVANAFAKALKWTEADKKEFTSLRSGETLPLSEGSFSPGVYVVSRGSKPHEVQDMVNERFRDNVLSRYSASTAEIIPLSMALTIASLIERETIGTDDMRIVSGIIWNRIFTNMNLQLDATLQYAKTNNKKVTVWWPQVLPQDKFIRSPYNTYMNAGLPPTPIASPSVAAIMAALNPAKTECIFYFHTGNGDLHCTPTYKEHVALLKQHYGRGR